MDNKSFSLQNYANAELLLAPRFEPFSLLLSKEGTLSPTLTQLSSPASSSSSTSAIRTQHQYCLTNGDGKSRPWLTLRMISRSPKSKHLPLYIGKDAISGEVELEFVKPETVREVKVTVRLVSDVMHHSRLTAK